MSKYSELIAEFKKMIMTEADLIETLALVIQITTLETTIIIDQITDDLIITALMIALDHEIGIDPKIIITRIITDQILLIDHKAMTEADLGTDIEAVIEMIIIEINQEADPQLPTLEMSILLIVYIIITTNNLNHFSSTSHYI